MVRRDNLDNLEVSTIVQYQFQQCTLQADCRLDGHTNHMHVSAEIVDAEQKRDPVDIYDVDLDQLTLL